VIIKLNCSFYKNGELVTNKRRILLRFIKKNLLIEVMSFIGLLAILLDLPGKQYFLTLYLAQLVEARRFDVRMEMRLISLYGPLALYKTLRLIMFLLFISHCYTCIAYSYTM